MEENKVTIGSENTVFSKQEQAKNPIGSAVSKPKMKWFYFLIYFGLWVFIIISFIEGVQYLTGTVYMENIGVSAKFIYGMFPGLKVLDILHGCAKIILGIQTAKIYKLLADFKKDSPDRFLNIIVESAVILGVYLLIGGIILKVSYLMDIILALLSHSIFYILNRIYFKKRYFLFKNNMLFQDK